MPKQANPEGGSRGTSTPKAATPSSDRRPTPDQMYLADKLNGDGLWTFEESGEAKSEHAITPAALNRWNHVYGVVRTTEALRVAWGFPPLAGIENPYAYVAAILRGEK